MSAPQEVRIDERTVAVLRAGNVWGLNVIVFGLFIDIFYRSAVRKEAPWDLFALLGIGGAVSMLYLARHKVLGQVLNWKVAIIGVVVAFVVGAVSALFLAMTKVM